MLPTDAKERKGVPIYSGFVVYFPDGMQAVAMLSFDANEQHNPGEPVHWAKEKSTDEKDALMRHLVDPLAVGGDVYDTDGHLHATKKAWRAMADLQRLLESGVPVKRQPIYTQGQEDAIRAAGGDPRLPIKPPMPRPHRAKCHVTCGSLKCEREGCEGANRQTNLEPGPAPTIVKCGARVVRVNGTEQLCTRKSGHAGRHSWAPPPYCHDCGADLEESGHSANCLRGGSQHY